MIKLEANMSRIHCMHFVNAVLLTDLLVTGPSYASSQREFEEELIIHCLGHSGNAAAGGHDHFAVHPLSWCDTAL